MHVEPHMRQEAADSDADRRKYERLPHGVRLAVVQPTLDTSDLRGLNGTVIEGWSQDISPGGICFLCLTEIAEELVWIRTEENPDYFGEVRIIRTREVIEGLWEYGCRLERLVPRFLG